jgi:hypothetical protein
MRTANTATKRLGRVDAHRASLDVPGNHDATSAVAATAAFMGCSGGTSEVSSARWRGARAIRVLPRQSQLEFAEDRAIGRHASLLVGLVSTGLDVHVAVLGDVRCPSFTRLCAVGRHLPSSFTDETK